MILKPLNDRVIVKPLDADETTSGGIFLPDLAQEKSQRGRVIAVGPGRLLDSGERLSVVARANESAGDAVGAVRQRYEAFLSQLASGQKPESQFVHGLIDSVLRFAPSVVFLEDREQLRSILVYWGAYLQSLGEAFPDVDIDMPNRRPSKVYSKSSRGIKLKVAVGDEVLFGTYGASDIEMEGTEYKILRESDILAKII